MRSEKTAVAGLFLFLSAIFLAGFTHPGFAPVAFLLFIGGGGLAWFCMLAMLLRRDRSPDGRLSR